MGVPSFFAFLRNKFTGIVTDVEVDTSSPLDSSSQLQKRPFDCDNLYLDLNGVIHTCVNVPEPQTEQQWMGKVTAYLDHLIHIAQPKELIFLALDGVAPRAKMNQQRARRFVSARERAQAAEAAKARTSKREADDMKVDPGASFDSNSITPGTPFMLRLGELLAAFVKQRTVSKHPDWAGRTVILSDSSSPGEGEHKIIAFIRYLHSQKNYTPKHHVMYGGDADIILLALATHEPLFTILREKPPGRSPRSGHGQGCFRCGNKGHRVKDCPQPFVSKADLEKRKAPAASAASASGESSLVGVSQAAPAAAPAAVSFPSFCVLNIAMLRYYIHHDMVGQDAGLDGRKSPAFQPSADFERVLDDWIFLSFFAGNDFLPHIPSINIYEGGLETLTLLYQQMRKSGKLDGPLVDRGLIHTHRVVRLAQELGRLEAGVLRGRAAGKLQQYRRLEAQANRAANVRKAAEAAASAAASSASPGAVLDDISSRKAPVEPTAGATGAAGEVSAGSAAFEAGTAPALSPFVLDLAAADGVSWLLRFEREPGAYYREKLAFGVDEEQGRRALQGLLTEYIEGLRWVAYYYFAGVPSWSYFFPFHYAPLASSFVMDALSEEDRRDNCFKLPRNNGASDLMPPRPFIQLMSVLPASSAKKLLPEPLSALMDSPSLRPFYPSTFDLDLNGAKQEWKAVVVLPFIDIQLLLTTVAPALKDLSYDEQDRNSFHPDFLVLSSSTNHEYMYRLGLVNYLCEERAEDDPDAPPVGLAYRLGHVCPPRRPADNFVKVGAGALAFQQPTARQFSRYLGGRHSKNRMGASKLGGGAELAGLEREMLSAQLLRQVEYYFSDKNLPRDKFLQKTMLQHKGWVPVHTIASFKQVQLLSRDVALVTAAIRQSPTLLQLSPDGTMLRRRPLETAQSVLPPPPAPLRKGGEEDLLDQLDLGQVVLLNARWEGRGGGKPPTSEQQLRQLFGLGGSAGDPPLLTDTDEQALVVVPLKPLKARRVIPRAVYIFHRAKVEGKEDGEQREGGAAGRPRAVKLFDNPSAGFDFSNAEEAKPSTSVTLTATDFVPSGSPGLYVARIDVPTCRDTTVAIGIFIEDNAADLEVTAIAGISIFGSVSERVS